MPTMRLKFIPVAVLMCGLMLVATFPTPALADDSTPTPPPVVADTPTAPPVATSAPIATAAPTADTSSNGVQVSIASSNTGNGSGSDLGPAALANKLPIWCPAGVDPVPGQNGCTAQFGSLSLLLDYLNSNNLADQGKIWIPDPGAQADPNSTSDPATAASATDTSAAASPAADATNGVNIVILDSSGASLPLDSAAGADALTSGQPVWCPDGSTPATDSQNCTDSSASLGLLVSMIQNGSLDNSTIYVKAAPSTDAGGSQDSANAPANTDAATPALPDAAPTDALATPVDATPAPAVNDPIWCPNGSPPNPGSGGCTSTQPDLASLVAFLSGIDASLVDGTIWIQQGSDSSAGAITINNVLFPIGHTHALTLQGGWSGVANDATISGSTTFSKSITVSGWLADVAVNDLSVSGSAFTGLTVQTTGNITLDNVAATGNAGDGASLDNTAGASSSVTLNGTNNFNSNTVDGLRVQSKGDVTVNNIAAQSNLNTGALIRNDFGTGSVQLTGSGTFSNNGTGLVGSGLRIFSTGSIFVNSVTASSNKNVGAFAQTDSASINFTGTNTFTGDNTNGLRLNVTSGGSIDLQNVTASGNGAEGVLITLASGGGSGAVNVSGTNSFNGNAFGGISISTYGDITLSNADASGNLGTSSGAILGTPGGNITINCGTFNNNPDFGLSDNLGSSPPATLSLNGPTFAGNGTGTVFISSGSTLVVNNPGSCPVPSAGGGNKSIKAALTGSPVLGFNLVNVDEGSGSKVSLDCINFGGTLLQLPNDDRVLYFCPTNGEASLIHVKPEALPGPLPGNLAFMSAMQTHLTRNGLDQTLTDGNLLVSFVIPVDLAGFDVAIMYWDGSNWLDLSTAAFADGRLVFNGGVKTTDGRFEATTNFTGTFVLVRK